MLMKLLTAVFHEFLKTAKILGIALRQYDIPFYYFNGEMSAKSREDAITSFKNNPSIKVLVSSPLHILQSPSTRVKRT